MPTGSYCRGSRFVARQQPAGLLACQAVCVPACAGRCMARWVGGRCHQHQQQRRPRLRQAPRAVAAVVLDAQNWNIRIPLERNLIMNYK